MKSLFVLDTPAVWEVIKRLAAYQLHGIDYAPSHGSHVTTLIACGCDWAGVSLSLLLVIASLGATQRS